MWPYVMLKLVVSVCRGQGSGEVVTRCVHNPRPCLSDNAEVKIMLKLRRSPGVSSIYDVRTTTRYINELAGPWIAFMFQRGPVGCLDDVSVTKMFWRVPGLRLCFKDVLAGPRTTVLFQRSSWMTPLSMSDAERHLRDRLG